MWVYINPEINNIYINLFRIENQKNFVLYLNINHKNTKYLPKFQDLPVIFAVIYVYIYIF